MIKKRDFVNKCTFFMALLVGIYPIMPEYFAIGKIPVYYLIPILGVLLICIRTHSLQVSKQFLRRNYIFIVCSVIPFLIHGQMGTLLNWFITTLLILYLVNYYFHSKEQIECALDIVLFTSIIINVFSLFERLTEYNVWSVFETAPTIANDSSAYYRNGIIRIESSFGVALTFALYLLFINIVALYKLSIDDYKSSGFVLNKKRIGYIIAYILSLVCMVFTQCRLPLITLIFVQACFALRGNTSKKIKGIVVSLCLLLVFAIVFGDVLVEKVSTYFSLIIGVFAGLSGKSADDLTTAYRIELIPALIPYIKNKPLLGYGASYINKGFSFLILDHQHTSIDNNYLAQAMYYGIVGLVGNVYWLFNIIKNSIKKRLKKVKIDYFEFSIGILCVAYMVNLFSVYQMAESHLFYLLVGLYCKYESIKKGTL